MFAADAGFTAAKTDAAGPPGLIMSPACRDSLAGETGLKILEGGLAQCGPDRDPNGHAVRNGVHLSARLVKQLGFFELGFANSDAASGMLRRLL